MPRTPLMFISMFLVLAAAASSARTQEAPPALPQRLALIPFDCPRGCSEMQSLQASLVSELVERKVFELVMTEETEALFLNQPRFRSAMDTLRARAWRGLPPDSTSAGMLARRFGVEGFLFATNGLDGMRVGLWKQVGPGHGLVYSQARFQDVRGTLPSSKLNGPQDKGASPQTGGTASSGGGGAAGASSSGNAAAGSGGARVSSEASATLKSTFSGTPELVNTSSTDDERGRQFGETVARQLQKLMGKKSESGD